MARKARERYVVKHEKYHTNGLSMMGVEVILIGPCGGSGALKTAAGKKLPKKDLTRVLLRFADKKMAKQLGVSSNEFTFDAKTFPQYFQLIND